MNELVIGILVLILAFPLGSYLRKLTLDEQKQGKKWFFYIMILGVLGAIISLILRNDVLMFTSLFTSVIALQSWR